MQNSKVWEKDEEEAIGTTRNLPEGDDEEELEANAFDHIVVTTVWAWPKGGPGTLCH